MLTSLHSAKPKQRSSFGTQLSWNCHMILTLPVCVCFCSHAKLRCMCSCNRCTYCICHNLLNSELVRSVKAKFYSAILNRSLSIALYIPRSPSPQGDLSNIGFLTHHLSSLLAVGLTGLHCISTERCWEIFWLYVKMITSVLF